MSNRILSYRGLLADGGQETILLSTKKGEVGYRILKFQLMPGEPGDGAGEHVMKIYKEEQSSIDGKIDFSDNRLLAAAHIANSATTYSNYSGWPSIIFDQEIVNQDIYITHEDSGGAGKINWYLELQVIKLDESQAMVATLKDIRNNS
jgi:hypothetical protein